MSELATVLLSAAVGGLVGGGALMGLIWHALENRLRGTFVLRDESRAATERVHDRLDRKRKEIERAVGMVVSMDDRIGVVEGKVERMDERQSQHWERISEQLTRTAAMNDSTSRRLEQMGEQLRDLAIRLERIKRAT